MNTRIFTILVSFSFACEPSSGESTGTDTAVGASTSGGTTSGGASTGGPVESSGSPTTTATETSGAESSTGGEGHGCVCLPEPKTCHFDRPCESAKDCCPDNLPAIFTCNETVPYIYTCEQGVCKQDITCSNVDECRPFFGFMHDAHPELTGKGCLPHQERCDSPVQNICILDIPPECVEDADCCDPNTLPKGYTCMDFPYHKSCVEGSCEPVDCASDMECDAHYEITLKNRGWYTFGCVSDGCHATCRYTREPCEKDEDCCTDPPPGFTCKDFPYNKSCVAGACQDATCEEDYQCVALFEAEYKSEGYVLGGCQ